MAGCRKYSEMWLYVKEFMKDLKFREIADELARAPWNGTGSNAGGAKEVKTDISQPIQDLE